MKRIQQPLVPSAKLLALVRSTMAKTACTLFLALIFVLPAPANSIINGGFETGDFTGWTQSGWFIDALNPNSGVYDASTGCSGASCTSVGDPNSAYLYQDVATTPGTTYDVSFFYGSGQLPTLGSELLVSWGDPTAPNLATAVDILNIDTSGAYVQYIGIVTATSATSQLEFLGRQDLDFYYVDDVSLAAPAASVPEPNSCWLLLSAITVLLLPSWQRRRRGNATAGLNGSGQGQLHSPGNPSRKASGVRLTRTALSLVVLLLSLITLTERRAFAISTTQNAANRWTIPGSVGLSYNWFNSPAEAGAYYVSLSGDPSHPSYLTNYYSGPYTISTSAIDCTPSDPCIEVHFAYYSAPSYIIGVGIIVQYFGYEPYGQTCLDGSYAGNGQSCVGKSLGVGCYCGRVRRGNPIDVGSGNKSEEATDYETANQNKLRFARYYNSRSNPGTLAVSLGMSWRSNYDRYIVIESATSVIAERADGQQLAFTLTGGVWVPDSDIDVSLTQTGAAWALIDYDDTVETYALNSFGTAALLTSIQARNGYTQTLSYSNGQLALVVDSYGRFLTLTYANSLLIALATPDGTTINYGYTSEAFGSNLTYVTYSTSPATTVTYLYENASLPNALTGIIDENGARYATWVYDAFARGLSSQHGTGADLTTIAYNDADGSRAVTNALGEQEMYRFATLQGVPKVTEIDRLATGTTAAAKQLLTYDSNGYTASATDWNGNLTSYTNNSHGFPSVISEAVGTSAARTTTIVYDLTFVHLPDSIATPGLTTSFTYDSHGNPLTKTLTDTTATIIPYSTKGQGRTWAVTWSNFLLTSTTSPHGNSTNFTYDGTGALVKVTNALNHVTNITAHMGGGLPETIIDSNGVALTRSYDARQHLIGSAVLTGGGLLTTSFFHDAAENLTSVVLPDGSAATNGYDTAHRLVSVTDLFGNRISYTLDALGDETQTAIANPSNVVQSQHSANFDALGRVLKDIGGAGQTTTFAYDSNGNALTVTDPLSHLTQQAFDGLNRLSRIIDAALGITKTTYDQHDRPITIVDPNSGSTTYVYDGFGEAIQRISPDSGTTVYRYDADGNVTQTVDGRGAIANYTYDALDRVLTTTFPADPAENVAYSYDQPGHGFGVGRLTSVIDAAGALSRTYDERGNDLSERRVNGPLTLTTAYTYDPASRISSITYPSGATIAYSRDAMGRVQSLSATPPGAGTPAPIVSAVAWLPFGPPSGLTFGNGVTEHRSFDLAYRMTQLTDTGAAPLQSLTYGNDASNNVLAIADGVTEGNSQAFGYDSLNHLTSAAGAYGSLGYTYSPIGNRLTQTVGSTVSSYTYAPHSNQLTAIKTGILTQATAYTGSGNISSITPSTGTATTLTYNQANRLASVAGTPMAIFGMVYDAFGQRFSKASGGTANYFIYGLDGSLLEEMNNGVATDYVYVNGIPVAEIAPSTGKVYFLHDDRLGTPQAATDASQNIVWSANYQPFGDTGLSVTGSITQSLRLPGQYADFETGFSHNGLRDYMSGLGRYLESDPIGLSGGLNAYSYVQQNPLVYTDPSGLVNLNLIRTNSFLQHAEDYYNPQGVYSVSAHGTPQHVLDETTNQFLTAERLANLLYQNGYLKGSGKTVVLHACMTGSGANSFAQQLSTNLGASVIAPNDAINGFVVSNSVGLIENALTVNGGQFYLFTPHSAPVPLGPSY